MKKMSVFARGYFVGAIALAVAAMPSAARAQAVQQEITILRVKGMARSSTDNKTWQTLKAGDVLKPGCVIQTAPKSLVDLQMGERETAMAPVSYSPAAPSYTPEEQTANVVRIFENTSMAIDKLTAEGTGVDRVEETQLDLRAGQIMGNVKKLSAASKYEVKIPNGVAGIRGTVYMISASGVVNVLSGSVVVAIVGADGTVITRIVTAHESYDPFTNTITRLSEDQVKVLESIYAQQGGPHQTPAHGAVPGTPILEITPH